MIKIIRFDELTSKEVYDIFKLRQDIFVVEQKCPYNDINELDLMSYHALLYINNELKATLRIFYKSEYIIQIGRVCTKEHKKGYGRTIMEEAMKFINDNLIHEKIYLEGQTYAIKFYESFNFKVVSDVFLEDDIPHVKMENDID